MAPPVASTSGYPRAKPGLFQVKSVPIQYSEEDSTKQNKGVNDALSFANKPLLQIPSLAGFTNLHRLDLSNTSIKEIGFIKEVKSTLTWLNVSGNDLSRRGAWIGIEQLTKLFVLNASNCSLTVVPLEIKSLSALKALVLSSNRLTTLTHVENLLDLNTLVISNNTLTSLPASLTTLSSLKKISAAHNQLTSATLPDLTTLAQLREVKLNDNPGLSSLPAHTANWGKGTMTHIEFKGKRPPGLEILDLGNCGFEGWMDLQPLVGQANIINLVLKGTKVAEAAKEEGFDDYKQKLTILLPTLRILDGQRFDAKYHDLRTKRLARPELDVSAYPTGPVIASTATTSSMKSRKEEQRAAAAEMRARELGLPAVPSKVEKGKGKEVASEIVANVGRKKDLKSKPENIEKTAEKIQVTKPIKRKNAEVEKEVVKPNITQQEGNGKELSQGADKNGSAEERAPKKKKNRHDVRREAETGDAARHATSTTPSTDTRSAAAPVVTASTLVATATKSKKRKAGEVVVTRPVVVVARPEKETKVKIVRDGAIDKPQAVEKKRKHKNGVLSALKGDDSEQAAESAERTKARVFTNPVPEEATLVEKVKTSVAGIVLVKKDRIGGMDVGSLLSKPKVGAMSWN